MIEGRSTLTSVKLRSNPENRQIVPVALFQPSNSRVCLAVGKTRPCTAPHMYSSAGALGESRLELKWNLPGSEPYHVPEAVSLFQIRFSMYDQ